MVLGETFESLEDFDRDEFIFTLLCDDAVIETLQNGGMDKPSHLLREGFPNNIKYRTLVINRGGGGLGGWGSWEFSPAIILLKVLLLLEPVDFLLSFFVGLTSFGFGLFCFCV